MATNITLTQGCTDGSDTFSNSTTHACSTVVKLNETIATGVTDQEHVIGIDISALQVFYMVSDYAVTVQTNDGTTPDDTFTLVADQPVVFETGGTNPFSADVTKIYVTNASGSTATLKIIAGQNQ
jgi:hypothetical protein